MKYTNENARRLHEKYKEFEAAQKAEEDRCDTIFNEYIKMEGKYGKMVYNPYYGQGQRNYAFEYPSDSVRILEETERRQFLKDNNYRTPQDINREFEPKLKTLWNDFCLAQYGKTARQKELERQLKLYQRELTEARQIVSRYEGYIKKIEEELRNNG